MPSRSSQDSWSEPAFKRLTSPHLDSDGTCTIFYGCPNQANSSFPKPENMADIRNVVLRFHMKVDVHHSDPSTYDAPAMEFEYCPIWHFIDDANEIKTDVPKPTCSIIIIYDEADSLSRDYNSSLSILLGLMRVLTQSGFEDVRVKILFAPSAVEGPRASWGAQEDHLHFLKPQFERRLGRAMMYAFWGDECELEFRPGALAKKWIKDARIEARRRHAEELRLKKEFENSQKLRRRGMRGLSGLFKRRE